MPLLKAQPDVDSTLPGLGKLRWSELEQYDVSLLKLKQCDGHTQRINFLLITYRKSISAFSQMGEGQNINFPSVFGFWQV